METKSGPNSDLNVNKDDTKMYCDICETLRLCFERAKSYCTICTHFMCDECKETHEKCPGLKDHELLFGEDMPTDRIDRYPKYKSCSIHQESITDLFCFSHKTLVCLKCYEDKHEECLVQPVTEVSERVDKRDIDNLKDTVSDLTADIEYYRSSIDDNIVRMETQRSNMLKEAQAIHGSLIAKINYLFYEIKGEIFRVCKEQSVYLSEQKTKIDDVLSKLEGCLNAIDQMKAKSSNEGAFISIQDIVSQSRQYSFFLLELHRTSRKKDCSLKPSHDTLELLDSNFCFGSVDLTQREHDIAKIVPDISFPIVPVSPSVRIRSKKERKQTTRSLISTCSSSNSARSSLTSTRSSLNSTLDTIEEEEIADSIQNTEIQEDKTRISLRKSVHIHSDDDTKGSLINAIAVTDDGKRILADFNNQNLKLFGPTMKLLSTFSLSSAAKGLCYVGRNEIVVSNKERQLLFMKISDNTLKLENKLKVKYPVDALACDENIYLFRGSNPPSIRKIDKSGKILWTARQGKMGHKLFKSACDITCSIVNRDTRVVASDDQAESIIMLDGETGNILAVKNFKGKEPRSLATDSHGNIFVCYAKTHEICMMTRNLTEDKILLCSLLGLCPEPLAIAYDSRSEQVIVSNNLSFHKDTVDIFQKTFYI